MSEVVVGGFSIDVGAALYPGRAIPVEDSDLAGIVAVVRVARCANDNRVAVCGEGEGTADVSCVFPIDVAGALNSGRAIPSEDAYMAGIVAIAVIA